MATASRPAADVAVRTSRPSTLAVALMLGVAANARAEGGPGTPSDEAILGDAVGWRIEDVQLRTTYLDQRGHGYQSQDTSNVGVPGSERMYVVQPSALVRVRQSARVTHEIVVPVDAITAASPDAVDATSSASRRNLAVDIDVRSAIRIDDHGTVSTRISAHFEEPLSGGTLGLGYRRRLADDNATIGISGSVTVDGFDNRDHVGNYLGKTVRTTVGASLTASQLLSPTTTLDGSYGVTRQHGTLETPWNAVVKADGNFTDEVLPRDRTRHAMTANLAQHVPLTRTTARLAYRYYRDDFGIHAHTVEGAAYQYLASWLYVRAAYRFHDQTSPRFFATVLEPGFDIKAPRTADSDLAAFRAHEWSLQLTSIKGRGPLRAWSASAEVLRYSRSNDLRITAVTLSIGRVL